MGLANDRCGLPITVRAITIGAASSISAGKFPLSDAKIVACGGCADILSLTLGCAESFADPLELGSAADGDAEGFVRFKEAR